MSGMKVFKFDVDEDFAKQHNEMVRDTRSLVASSRARAMRSRTIQSLNTLSNSTSKTARVSEISTPCTPVTPMSASSIRSRSSARLTRANAFAESSIRLCFIRSATMPPPKKVS